jgi:group I intron endonuclease
MENKNFNTGIYQIVNLVNGKRYIGSAANLKLREKQHKECLKGNRHHNKYLQNSYDKYSEDSFEFQVLLYCSKEDLIFYEQRAIDAYNFEDLYNLAPTAGNTLGFSFSIESKKKMSIKRKGINLSPETCLKMSESKKGEKHSSYGKKASIETRQKQSDWQKNMSDELRERLTNLKKLRCGKNNVTSKPVYQIDKNTNEIIKKWDAVRTASKELQISHSGIVRCCNNKINYKTAYGFKWNYVEGYENKKGE